MLKKSDGNMYDWVTHTHSHLAGECGHKCKYCYVQRMGDRFPALKAKYSGPVRIIEGSLSVRYGTGNTIFVDHMNDLFADNVPVDMIYAVLEHCKQWPGNTYVFQTKNPARAFELAGSLPEKSIIGTTVESNEWYPDITDAPHPLDRIDALFGIKVAWKFKTFITIEPVIDFNLKAFLVELRSARPDFINIGSDSKKSGLPEPSAQKLVALIEGIKDAGIEIRQKHNLKRLLTKPASNL